MVSAGAGAAPPSRKPPVDKAVWHRGLSDEAQLKKLLEDHHRWTGSKRAREMLDTWAESRGKFVKVFPNEYKRALGEINARKTAAAATTQSPGFGQAGHRDGAAK
jgi:glutamate synthase (NADPH) large chain